MTAYSTLLSPRPFAINRMIWYVIAAIGVLDLVLAQALGIGFSASAETAPLALLAFATCIALSLVYRYARRDDQIFLFTQSAAQMILAILTLGVLSYLTAWTRFPLTDPWLIIIDRFFFFDWREWLAWLNRYPTLAAILSLIYISSGFQIIAIMIALLFSKQAAGIQRLLVAFFCAGLLTIILAMLFPAVGGYVHYDIDVASAFPGLQPAAARVHELPLLGMREHSTHILVFPMQGLVTFPSFHCALSLLLIYACRPLRRLQLIVVPLNLLVLLSTPADGGHYLADILGGVGVGFLAIWMTEKLFARFG